MSDRRVLLASPRGFCAGVERAVQTVEKALDLYGPPVYVRHQIVHNKHVVEALEQRGAVFVEEVDEVPSGAVVIYSAHGIAPEVRSAAATRDLHPIDATCPLVTKVHREAERFAREDYDILLIGHAGHEEVVGTLGHAPERIHLVDGPEDVADVKVRDPARVAWLSQTTLSVDETAATAQQLRERFPLLQDPPSEDICYATQNRQTAVRRVAGECDLLLVVGSANSSNSLRLVEVALDAGARAAHLVDDPGGIDEGWFDGVRTVGLTSGASAPEELVAQVLDYLAERGYGDVSQVEAAEEHTVFALPHELGRPRPGGAAPVLADPAPADSVPDEGQPTDFVPVEPALTEPTTGVSAPADAVPADAVRTDAVRTSTDRTDAVPAETVRTEPIATNSAPADPRPPGNDTP
nr:4-hydroxy-3-methylbut-2-enyl diphosphate reductase [Catenulispora rubra]